MDLASLAVTHEGQTLQLRHPIEGTILKTEDDEPITITLVGTDSDVFRKAQRTILDRRLNQKGKTKLSAAELEEEAVTTLISCTLGWSGIVLDGEELAFSAENVRKLYSRTDLPWIRDQVDEFIADRANFLKPSATS
ncbi:hypothetical protein QBD01_003677 [Ochrobactrum sp. 19YEA23]|uniref:hypothetical protein n=1 Tax=Ochrobactrum sp. 19YEA23 TaxID=3039854 RepID=UPI002478BB08|nr:hypothetical protein [Ochrobactrum sp. 19YEA23]